MPPKKSIASGFSSGLKTWCYMPYCDIYTGSMASGKDKSSGKSKNTAMKIELSVKENRLFNHDKKRIKQIQRLLKKSIYK